MDWNNAHPWKAPADAKAASAKLPAWWGSTAETDWGYNMWNRTYEADGKTGDMVFGAGNGGQVIRFESFPWTPVRPRTTAGNDTNFYNDRVSYDYPKPSDGSTIRAYDSPFAFVYKMNEQKKAIRSHFKGVIDNDATKENAVGEYPQISEDPDGKYPANSLSNKALASWNSTRAPDDWYRFYWSGDEAYLPGLGLYLYSTGNANNEAGLGSVGLSADKNKSAGTDCLAFVQRSAGYVNTGVDSSSDNSRLYKWKTMAGDIAETGDVSSIDGKARDVHFPYDLSEVIVSRNGISNKVDYFTNTVDTNAPTPKQFEEIRKKFMSIVPGDVMMYWEDEETEYHHIGEIKKVDYDAMGSAKTISDLMSAVTVIESVFNSNVQYVMMRNMMQGATSNLSTGNGYTWHEKNKNELRNWEIRRLSK